MRSAEHKKWTYAFKVKVENPNNIMLQYFIKNTQFAQWVYARLTSERPQMQVHIMADANLPRAT